MPQQVIRMMGGGRRTRGIASGGNKVRLSRLLRGTGRGRIVGVGG